MSTRTVEDLEGNKLQPTLLRIVEQDERGPRVLRVQHNDEKIDLSNGDNNFLVVWVADAKLAVTELGGLVTEFHTLKEGLDERIRERAQLGRDIENVQREIARYEERDKAMTEELRQLRKEQDPGRFEAAVKIAVETKTADFERRLTSRDAEIFELKREIEELRTSKKRLKEANERLKEQQKR